MNNKRINFLLLAILFICNKTTYSQIQINEIQASNRYTTVDEFGDRDDWFEIFNAGEKEIDIAGYVLKDNVDTWAIPLNDSRTKMTAKGYLVFWADDEEETEGIFHTNFKLSASNGEFLGLFLPDSVTVVDSIRFPPLNDDEVYARCAEQGWKLKTKPTPGKINICNEVRINKIMQKASSITFLTKNNSTIIYIPENIANYGKIEIFNILGNVIKIELNTDNQIILDSKNYKAGVYILKYSGNGNTNTLKFAVQ